MNYRLLIIVAAIAILITIVAIVLFTPQAEVIVEPSNLHVGVIALKSTVCEFPILQVTFTDDDGKNVNHVNYDILVYQNDAIILFEREIHHHSNVNSTRTGDVLLGVFPMEIHVTTLGLGHDPLPESMGITTSFTVIPQTAINVNCELLHETEDALPQ